MGMEMIAVDINKEVSQREQDAWEKHGFSTVRVNTMHEAIQLLTKRSSILVAINADNIDYKPTLEVMRSITDIPILIIASRVSGREQAWALSHGADGFAQFETPEVNVQLALAMIMRVNARHRHPINPQRILVQGNLIMYPAQRKVFCENREIKLTGKEFEILKMLMEKQGVVFTHEQIYTQVWRLEYHESAREVVWTQVRRLRNKLQFDPSLPDFIKTVRDVGYSAIPQSFDFESA